MPADTRDLVTFDGGPWRGWWMTADDLEANRRAAELTRTGADTSRRYVESKTDRINPEGYGSGRVWNWRTPDPTVVVCRLCTPTATATTATYCGRCQP